MIITGIAIELVVILVTVERISTIAAFQCVVAMPAIRNIVAGAASRAVMAAIGVDRVVAKGAIDSIRQACIIRTGERAAGTIIQRVGEEIGGVHRCCA